jgi:hypothetical protein
MRKVLTVATLALAISLGAACGGESSAPVLSNLKMPDTATRGALTQGTVFIKDTDGLGGLEVHIRMIGTATMPKTTAPVLGVSDAVTEYEIPFQFALTASTPTGPYTFYISASDPDANTSNELSKPIVVN